MIRRVLNSIIEGTKEIFEQTSLPTEASHKETLDSAPDSASEASGDADLLQMPILLSWVPTQTRVHFLWNDRLHRSLNEEQTRCGLLLGDRLTSLEQVEASRQELEAMRPLCQTCSKTI